MIYSNEIYERRLLDFGLDSTSRIGIYGTGNGARIVYDTLKKWNLRDCIKCFIERDEYCEDVTSIEEIPITKLSLSYDLVDSIIVAAMDNHAIIHERINKAFVRDSITDIRIIDLFNYNTREEIQEYLDWLWQSLVPSPEEFVHYDCEGIELQKSDPKVIAWYLPQYYEIDINNKYYGKGFTEWTNTSKMFPLFAGHVQPHIPYDVGYYDLSDVKTMKRQIELAKHYGVYGFSFYYYWFSGERIMEKPLNLFLEHVELDFPFCITWANENWTTLWDAGETNLLFKQELLDNDPVDFIDDVFPILQDSRYIRIDGKPLLLIYRANMWTPEKTKRCMEIFREEAKKRGVELYLAFTNARDFDSEPRDYGADALVEFPPHGVRRLMKSVDNIGYINSEFSGKILDASSFVHGKGYLYPHNVETYFRGVLTTWDNSARKTNKGALIFQGLNAKSFKEWLLAVFEEGKRIHGKETNLVFVNSWNEWGEGSHLEPDTRTGYAMLESLKEAIIESR